MVPMSEYDTTEYSEGCLATTIDRKDKRDLYGSEETSFISGMLLIISY